jgi:hypothetical protein
MGMGRRIPDTGSGGPAPAWIPVMFEFTREGLYTLRDFRHIQPMVGAGL